MKHSSTDEQDKNKTFSPNDTDSSILIRINKFSRPVLSDC